MGNEVLKETSVSKRELNEKNTDYSYRDAGILFSIGTTSEKLSVLFLLLKTFLNFFVLPLAIVCSFVAMLFWLWPLLPIAK